MIATKKMMEAGGEKIRKQKTKQKQSDKEVEEHKAH